MNFPLLFALLLGAPLAQATDPPTTLARVTTYCREEGQPHAASNGARLRNGHCAVDPKKVPYGSKIILGDEELIAVDTGPAVVSRKAARLLGRNRAEREAMVVDRYFETKSQAVTWEKWHPHFMKIQIVAPGMAKAVVNNSPPQPAAAAPVASMSIAMEPAFVARPNPALPISRDGRATLCGAMPYFWVFSGSSTGILRSARRRTGGECALAVWGEAADRLSSDIFPGYE